VPVLELAAVLAQEVSSPSFRDIVGPYGGVAVLVCVVYALLKDRAQERTRHETELAEARATYEADIAAHRKQLDVERQANRELADRLVASSERFAPVLAQAAQIMETIAKERSR
jgi:hypothetical protein